MFIGYCAIEFLYYHIIVSFYHISISSQYSNIHVLLCYFITLQYTYVIVLLYNRSISILFLFSYAQTPNCLCTAERNNNYGPAWQCGTRRDSFTELPGNKIDIPVAASEDELRHALGLYTHMTSGGLPFTVQGVRCEGGQGLFAP